MLTGPKELRPFTRLDGRSPFMDWVRGLKEAKTRSIIRNRLERFAEGNQGHWRPVGSGVYELKIYWGPGYRIYFGYDGPALIVLLIGGDKSSQWNDIREAQGYWNDYQTRTHGSQR